MRHVRVIVAMAALTLAVTLVAQSPMREGQWEIVGQMEMPGMPMKMPEMKTTRCITGEELKNPASTLATNPNPNDKSCKATDQKFDGNKVTWKMACTGAQAMTGDGEMVFQGDSYTGRMNMTTAQGAMTMKYSGKRLGDCPAKK
jgi:Protein of unknown function (DUF3617)